MRFSLIKELIVAGLVAIMLLIPLPIEMQAQTPVDGLKITEFTIEQTPYNFDWQVYPSKIKVVLTDPQTKIWKFDKYDCTESARTKTALSMLCTIPFKGSYKNGMIVINYTSNTATFFTNQNRDNHPVGKVIDKKMTEVLSKVKQISIDQLSVNSSRIPAELRHFRKYVFKNFNGKTWEMELNDGVRLSVCNELDRGRDTIKLSCIFGTSAPNGTKNIVLNFDFGRRKAGVQSTADFWRIVYYRSKVIPTSAGPRAPISRSGELKVLKLKPYSASEILTYADLRVPEWAKYSFYDPKVGPSLRKYWDGKTQHGSQQLYGMGDAHIMRSAARTFLSKRGITLTEANLIAVLDKVRKDPEERFLFAPYVLGAAFEALKTRNPNDGQMRFRKTFEEYMGFWRYQSAVDIYHNWREWAKSPWRQKSDLGIRSPASHFLPDPAADVDGFRKTQLNPLSIKDPGKRAILMLLEPTVAHSLPDYRKSRFAETGAELDALVASIGVGTTIGTSAGTLGLVSTAVFGYTVTLGLTSTTTAVTTAGGLVAPVTTSTATIGKATPAFLIAKGTIGGGGTAVGAAAGIGIGISIALAVVIGIALARQLKADIFDKK